MKKIQKWVVVDALSSGLYARVLGIFDRKKDAQQFVTTSDYSDTFEIHQVNYFSRENLQEMASMIEGDVPAKDLKRETMSSLVELYALDQGSY